ncbi:hypothetical protein H4582DRAFT_2087722 [Lactarius indigo]|nr:hypothetical protein H4582DRAFT_2087722 [Lactarius indigo]
MLLLWPYILSFFGTFDIGIPQTNKSKGNPELIAYTEPLFNIMPALAEHFYQGLHNPSIHPHTSDFVMHYICTYENFFTHQVQYSDSSRVATSMAALSPSLPSFGCNPTSSTLSIDLHLLTNHSHFKGISELLKLIYGSEQVKVIPAHKVEEEEHWYLWWGSYTKGSH